MQLAMIKLSTASLAATSRNSNAFQISKITGEKKSLILVFVNKVNQSENFITAQNTGNTHRIQVSTMFTAHLQYLHQRMFGETNGMCQQQHLKRFHMLRFSLSMK